MSFVFCLLHACFGFSLQSSVLLLDVFWSILSLNSYMDTILYEEEGNEVSGADVEKLASTSAYFATLRRRRNQARCPADSHLIIFPTNICEPDRVSRLYYRYTLKLPIRRSQARVNFSDLVYLVG